MNERAADSLLPAKAASIAGLSTAGFSVARFGPFELRFATRELYRDGAPVRLQRAPFQLLQALLLQPGGIVTREALRSELWSSDSLVDFESGLNTAINRLRSALGDSTENPIYIETLARVGYRFITPVTMLPRPSPPGSIFPAAIELSNVTGTESSPRKGLRKRALWIAATISALLAAFVAFRLHTAAAPAPAFHQLTFSRGFVQNARFASDGKHVLYSAAWNGKGSRLFLEDATSGESQDLGFKHARLASLSPSGQIALFSDPDMSRPPPGAPQIISVDDAGADWGPGNTLCLLRRSADSYTIEYPAGRALYTSTAAIGDIRVSRRGDYVAFLQHPIRNDDAGNVVVVNASGKARVLSSGWGSVDGLAWHPSGREVWFTAAQSGIDRNLMAVDLNGRTRQVAQIPGGMLLHDINAAGDVLIARSTARMNMLSGTFGARAPQDISWLDLSRAAAISSDGDRILFDESGQGGGSDYGVYVYDTRKRVSKLLGAGRALDLSPDGQWVLTQNARDVTALSLISVDGLQARPVAAGGLAHAWGKFLPGANRLEILMAANYPGKRLQLYRQSLPDGKPVLINTSAWLGAAIIDDAGRLAVGPSGKSSLAIVNLTNGSTRSIDNPKHVWPVAFAQDGQILTSRREVNSLVLELLDVATGRLRPFQRVDSADPAGTAKLFPVFVAKDLRTFVYSRLQILSTLYTVSGWS